MVHRGGLITLLMLVVSVYSQDISDTETVNVSQPCHHQIIKRLGNCCALPTFIPTEVMETCFTSECSGFMATAGRNGFHFMGWKTLFAEPGILFPSFNIPESGMPPKTPGVGELPQINFRGGIPDLESGFPSLSGFPVMGGRFPGMRGGGFPTRRIPQLSPPQDKDAEWVPPSTLQGSKNSKDRRKGSNTYSRKKRHGGGGRGNRGRGTFMCSMECIFRNLSLLTTEGAVDTVVATSKFSDVNNATWQPIVTAALSQCSQQLASTNLSAIPIPSMGGKICSPGPALYMACIRRYLALNCPDSFTAENNEICAGQMTALKICDPFAVAQCNRNGGSRRGWGGSWAGRRGGGGSWGRGDGGNDTGSRGGGEVDAEERPEKNRRPEKMKGRRG